MTRPDAHEPYDELAAGYALSALEPEDEQVFVQHLGACARCERELTVHNATLAHLAYASDATDPPDSLLASIRAGVLASGRGASFPHTTGLAAEKAERPPAALLSLAAARQRRTDSRLRRTGSWTGVAAAAALMLGLGVWNATLQQDRAEQDAWGDRMAVAVRELRDADTDTVPLRGDDGAVVAVALVRGSEMSLVVDGLPVNDASTTYVLWGQSRYGDVRPVGAFDVARGGLDVKHDMQVQAGIADVTRFMVTREQGEQAPPIPQQAVLASGDV